MKSQTTIALALTMGLMMLVSCNKINESVPENGFRATIEKSGGNSKTHIAPDWGNDNTTSILWSEYDLIKVANHGGQSGCQVLTYGLTEGENTTSGVFYTNEDHEGFFEPEYMAIYPAYNADESENTINGTTATFHIPAVQNYKENSFGEKSMPMVAYSETQALSFKNLFGGLCVPLTGDNVTVKRLVLTSHVATDNLCGMFTADCNGNANDNYGLTCTNETPCPSVTLDCGEGVQLTANDSVFFCIMVPPGAMNGTGESAGFSIAVYDPEDALVCTLSTTVNPLITRNNISLAGTKQNVVSDSHAYVDLGLPSGLLWATCNVGADNDNPVSHGHHFAWAETEPKSGSYIWSTYSYCNGNFNALTKYCNYSNYGYNGFTDNLTVLESADDAATVNWGGDWRMPTKEEWQELLANTDITWSYQPDGRRFTARNGSGNSIFLPAAGYKYGESYSSNSGAYWSSSVYQTNPSDANYFKFGSNEYSIDRDDRCYGMSVRAVRPAPSGWQGGTMGYESLDL